MCEIDNELTLAQPGLSLVIWGKSTPAIKRVRNLIQIPTHFGEMHDRFSVHLWKALRWQFNSTEDAADESGEGHAMLTSKSGDVFVLIGMNPQSDDPGEDWRN